MLDLDGAAALAAAIYTSWRTVSPIRLADWDDLQPEERRQWCAAIERVIALYRAEGLSIRSLEDDPG
jgi:hypothetical protein